MPYRYLDKEDLLIENQLVLPDWLPLSYRER